jgi:hypothetical protein
MDLLKSLSSSGNMASLLSSSFGAALLDPGASSSASTANGVLGGLVNQAISAYTQQQQAAKQTAPTSSVSTSG